MNLNGVMLRIIVRVWL